MAGNFYGGIPGGAIRADHLQSSPNAVGACSGHNDANVTPSRIYSQGWRHGTEEEYHLWGAGKYTYVCYVFKEYGANG